MSQISTLSTMTKAIAKHQTLIKAKATSSDEPKMVKLRADKRSIGSQEDVEHTQVGT